MSASESLRPEHAAPVTAEPATYVARASLENELRSRIKQQEALAQLGERALAEPDLERLLNDAVSTVALTLSVDFVKVLELLPGNTELVLRAGFRLEEGSRRIDPDHDGRQQLCPLHAGFRRRRWSTDDYAGGKAV